MMPTMQEIKRVETMRVLSRDNGRGGFVELPVDMRDRLCAAARRGVEADDRLTHLEEAYQSAMRAGSEAQRRAEQLEAELAALKMERIALARECIDAWENAVDWSSYASEYFREKHCADKDQDRLDAARDRLAMFELQAEREPALKAAQPERVSVPTEATVDAVQKGMRRAWQLGQTYWQQADSESWKQNAMAKETMRKFNTLLEETVAKLAAAQEGK